MFLEHFHEYIRPKRFFIVGNAMGWSTVALALVFPDALTVAIDAFTTGVEWTNELIARHRLSAVAVEARSPGDVAAVVKRYLKGPIDVSLIDATHTNDAIIADFTAVNAGSATNGSHLFHYVINRSLLPGFYPVVCVYNL